MTQHREIFGAYRHSVTIVAALVSLLLFIPFVVLVMTSWTEGSLVMFPPQGFSLQWYERVIQDPRWTSPFVLSIFVSALATLIAIIFGTAGALGVSRVAPRFARPLRTLFIVPIAIPTISYAVGLYGLNISLPPLRGTLVALVVGEALLAVPYVFVLVSVGVSRMDSSLRSAASTMGASWRMSLMRVELPILAPSIIGAAIFAFSIVFDEVVLSVYLTPPGVQTLPLKMLSAAQESFTPELTAASTLVSGLALIVLGLFALNSYITFKKRKRKLSH